MAGTTLAGTGNATARVASELRAAILRGAYQPGERIRQEVLATQFGASRLPVRDALRILEAEGLVTLVASTGAWVSQLSLEECQEIYQIRERLEPLLLRYSLPHLDHTAIRQLRTYFEQMKQTDRVEEFLVLDRSFHELTYSGAETSTLGDMVTRLWNATQHYRRAFTMLYGVQGNRTVHLEHELLLLAIERSDAPEAERVIRSHIRRTRLGLERHPEVFQH